MAKRAGRAYGDVRDWDKSPRKARGSQNAEVAAAILRDLDDEREAEQAFERRAAFGPGAVVVNVLTGKRYRT